MTRHAGDASARGRFLAATLTGVLMLTACAAPDDATPAPTPAPGSADPSEPAAPSSPAALEAPPGASGAELLATQEIVPNIEAAIADAAERFGVAPESVAVARSLRVSWSDGSLGCPEEGMMYTQAIVEGYLLTLEVDGQRYDYHGAMGDDPFLCERD